MHPYSCFNESKVVGSLKNLVNEYNVTEYLLLTEGKNFIDNNPVVLNIKNEFEISREHICYSRDGRLEQEIDKTGMWPFRIKDMRNKKENKKIKSAMDKLLENDQIVLIGGYFVNEFADKGIGYGCLSRTLNDVLKLPKIQSVVLPWGFIGSWTIDDDSLSQGSPKSLEEHAQEKGFVVMKNDAYWTIVRK